MPLPLGAVALLLVWLAADLPLRAAARAVTRPVVSVSRLSRPPVIEDFIDMRPPADLASELTMIEGFVQKAPVDGAPCSQKTQVFMGYDDRAFYFAFVAFDDEPEKIRANINRREKIFGDEIVEVQLDTFADERRAFSFIANPHGVQYDAIFSEGRGGGQDAFDDSWDTVWESDGRLTDRGYVVLMAIPFKSLRFSTAEEQTWGLLFARDIPRNNEATHWPAVTNRIEGRLHQAAVVTGLRGISPGRNVWLVPYATARRSRTLETTPFPRFERESLDADAGLDAKVVFKDSLTLDVTLNPDFSQVETDQAQVTANQRFEVFFPEKRPFFLENADLFLAPQRTVFTRRIVDPLFGARLTGKVGPWSLGALVTNDESPGKLAPPGDPLHGKDAFVSVLRVKRDVLSQSYVGFTFTDRELDSGFNRVGGLDTRFKIGDNWDNRSQVLFSRTRTLDGERLADPVIDVAFNREGRHLSTHLHYLDIGPEFVSEVGFFNRTDVRNLHGQASYKFWPTDSVLISWEPKLALSHIEDHDGLRLDDSSTPSVSFEFRRQTKLSLSYTEGRSRLRPEDFIVLPVARDFERDDFLAGFSTRPVNAVEVQAEYNNGRTINFVPAAGEEPGPADRRRSKLGLNWRPFSRLLFEGDYIRTELTDPSDGGRVFLNRIFDARINYQFNLRLSLRAIVQHERIDPDALKTSLERTKDLDGDLLVTYLINPWTALYLGTSRSRTNLDLAGSGPGATLSRGDEYLDDARQIFFKISYLFHM